MFGYYLLTIIIKPESQLILSGLMIYYTIIYIFLYQYFISCPALTPLFLPMWLSLHSSSTDTPRLRAIEYKVSPASTL